MCNAFLNLANMSILEDSIMEADSTILKENDKCQFIWQILLFIQVHQKEMNGFLVCLKSSVELSNVVCHSLQNNCKLNLGKSVFYSAKYRKLF